MNLLKEKKAEILEFIKFSGEVSIDEIAHRTGLGKATARQHLQDLEQMNLIESISLKQARGRPQLYYHLTGKAQELYPVQDGKLLYELITFLDKSGKQNILHKFFKTFWKRRQSDFESLLEEKNNKDFNSRVRSLKDLLKTEGFMPQIIKTKDHKVVIRKCNCPFPQAVRATKIPCRLEAEFVSFALNRPVVRSGYISEGRASCTYEVNTDNLCLNQ